MSGKIGRYEQQQQPTTYHLSYEHFLKVERVRARCHISLASHLHVDIHLHCNNRDNGQYEGKARQDLNSKRKDKEIRDKKKGGKKV